MSVQAETGEVLTTPEVLEQLENEHKGREKKKWNQLKANMKHH